MEYVEDQTRKHLEVGRGLELGPQGAVRDGEWQGAGRKFTRGRWRLWRLFRGLWAGRAGGVDGRVVGGVSCYGRCVLGFAAHGFTGLQMGLLFADITCFGGRTASLEFKFGTSASGCTSSPNVQVWQGLMVAVKAAKRSAHPSEPESREIDRGISHLTLTNCQLSGVNPP